MNRVLGCFAVLILQVAANAADDVVTLVHDGVERSCIVHRSAGGGAPHPLLLVLHGGGGDAAGMVGLTRRGFEPLADRDGAIVAYPDGVGRQWNDGRLDPSPRASHADDVGFLVALIGELDRRYDVARARVCATGMSNGAMMCLRLARERPRVFAAVAPVCGLVPAPLADLPWPGPTSALLIVGLQDPLVPYAGGSVTGNRGEVVSAARTVELLRAQARVADVLPTTIDLPDLAADGTQAREYRYRSPASRDAVDVIVVAGGGHTWPGGVQYLPELLIGRTCRDFDACRAIWRFCFAR